MSNPIYCVLYGRHSPKPTDDGDDKEESADRQIALLREHAKRNGYVIAGEYTDPYVSGAENWEDRQGMFAAVVACSRNYRFLVMAWDRLFRDPDEEVIFRTMLEKKGAQIMSVSEPMSNGNSPMATFSRRILLAIAEYERAIIRARTMSAMRRYQSQGRRMSSQPPYGQMIDPKDEKRTIEDPREAPAIEQIKEWHAEGCSLNEIARRLQASEWPPRGATWRHQTVKAILQREGVLPID